MKIIIMNELTAHSPRDKLARAVKIRLIEMGLNPIEADNWEHLKRIMLKDIDVAR